MTDDLLALRRLVETYAFGCDRRDLELLRSCFLEGAKFTTRRGDPSTLLTAPDDLAQIPTRLSEYDQTLHFVGNHWVELAGDDATGEVYCIAHHLTGTDDRVMHIRYEDRYRRTADGWRIAERALALLWTSYETAVL